jgi:adenylate cyclase
MRRTLRWLTKVTAYRIALVVGLAFAAAHLWEIREHDELPLTGRLESNLKDLKFRTRGQLPHSGRVVVAAVDEESIARFGRWPWDRRVLASMVDKLTAEGAAAIAFDMSFSDQDLGVKFAGAKRFRARFEDISLSVGKGRSAVDSVLRVDTDIAGAASALSGLSGKVTPEGDPFYKVARGRLEDGRGKIDDAKEKLQALVRGHAAFAAELDQDLEGVDPDTALAKALEKNGKAVVGFVALLQQDLAGFTEAEANENVQRLSRAAIGKPVYVHELGGGVTREEVIEPNHIKRYAGVRAPLGPIAKLAPAFGFFNVLPDQDGVIRSVGLALLARGTYLPSLDVMTVATVLGVPASRIRLLTDDSQKDSGMLRAVSFDDKLLVPTDQRGLLRVNYYGGDGTFVNYPIADIVDGKTPPGALKDKVVLVGATAQATFDQRVTPFQKITPGVETHANAIENMLAGTYLKRTFSTEMAETFLLIGLALLLGLVFAHAQATLGLLVAAGCAVILYAVNYALFRAGYDVIIALPLLETGSIFVFVTVFRYATEERDKRQLRKAFQLYLNPEVMEEMLKQPEKLQLGGQERELTVLFSDIRGFTTISEKLSPQALVHLLNEYLSPMTDIVFANKGTLDKYIGDAVMAFFGAPVANEKHALACCDAALQMMATLEKLREKWRIENPAIPHVDIGIGVHSGPMVVGNMGSQQRFNYTVMGDGVNLASRLEGLNKEYGTHVLISEGTLTLARRSLQGGPELVVRELDSVRVKGKKEPVRLFELRGRGGVPSADKPLLDAYARGLSLYREQKFSTARISFEECLELKPGDGPSRLFAERCDAMMSAPPGEGWDGVFQMTHK